MLIKGFFAIHVYDFLKKVHLYMSIQDYMAIRDLRVGIYYAKRWIFLRNPNIDLKLFLSFFTLFFYYTHTVIRLTSFLSLRSQWKKERSQRSNASEKRCVEVLFSQFLLAPRQVNIYHGERLSLSLSVQSLSFLPLHSS